MDLLTALLPGGAAACQAADRHWEQARLALALRFVTDLPLTAATVIAIAGDWQPGPAHTAIARPGWWQHREASWATEWQEIAAAAADSGTPGALTQITLAALTGALQTMANAVRCSVTAGGPSPTFTPPGTSSCPSGWPGCCRDCWTVTCCLRSQPPWKKSAQQRSRLAGSVGSWRRCPAGAPTGITGPSYAAQRAAQRFAARRTVTATVTPSAVRSRFVTFCAAWVCTRDTAELVRADRIVTLTAVARGASVSVFADAIGGTDGCGHTRYRLASCSPDDAPRLIARLVEQLPAAVSASQSRGWPQFVYFDASRQPSGWQVSRDLPAGWVKSPQLATADDPRLEPDF